MRNSIYGFKEMKAVLLLHRGWIALLRLEFWKTPLETQTFNRISCSQATANCLPCEADQVSIGFRYDWTEFEIHTQYASRELNCPTMTS